MPSFAEKVRLLMKETGLGITELERRYGKARTISLIVNGGSNGSDATEREFISKLRINKKWWDNPGSGEEIFLKGEQNLTPVEKAFDYREAYFTYKEMYLKWHETALNQLQELEDKGKKIEALEKQLDECRSTRRK